MSANGYLRADELTTVQGDMQLRNDTAVAWNAMKAAAALDGVTLTIARPEGDYRNWATQLDMRAHPSKYNITPGIVPGLPSEHGLGICVDVASGLAWVKKNGRRFGFTFPLAFDPNHARYDGTTIPAGHSGTPLREQEEEDEMAIRGITWRSAAGVAWCAQYSDTGFWSPVEGAAAVATALNASGIPFCDVPVSVAARIESDCAKVRTRTA